MPLYEYACQDCGQESELLVTNSSQPKCPKCGSTKVDKLLSIVAAPSRGTPTADRGPSAGPCGAHCGCHPHG
jgi:putative FmdB family regulatory protein